jgi:membrane protease YdiL (CAAX protease family)
MTLMEARPAADSAPTLARDPSTPPGSDHAVEEIGADDRDQPRAPTFWWFLAGYVVLNLLFALSVWFVPVVFVGYILFVHRVEHRRCRELRGGLRAVGECGLGLVLGALWWFVPFAAAFAASRAYSTSLTLADLRYAIAPVALVAFAEEPMDRGLLLRYSELRLGSLWAIAISSVIFAAGHLGSLFILADMAMVGAVLGAAYVLTRRLWLSIGIHAGNNLAIELVLEAHLKTQSGTFLTRWLLSIALLVGLLAIAHRRGALVLRTKAWAMQLGGDR